MQTLTILVAVVASLALTSCKSGGGTSDVSSSESAQERNPLIPRQFGPNYKYSELMIKDYDEMLAMVQDMVQKAHKATSGDDSGGEGEAVEWLGRATKLIFSRPDSDNMVSKLLAEVRRDLQGFNAYEDTIAGIADEAIRNAKDREMPVSVTSTSLVILENIMTEINPAVQNGSPEMRRVAEHIRDSGIRISDEVKKDRRMRGMFTTKNPADEAKLILKAADAKKKKK